jgi:small basic protein (TIGR04137 family)
MSIHPSLAVSEQDKNQRSVLKRTERIRTMMERGAWKEGDKVYGLPKIKTQRLKIKKEKAEEKTAVPGAAAPAATDAKAAPAKPAGKSAEKK